MKSFTFLTYSATALVSALNIASVIAAPGAESPAYGGNLPGDVEKYVYSFGQPRRDDDSKVSVPSYSWAFGDAEYEFPESESKSKSGSHARRAEEPKAPVTKETIFWVLAPPEQQPPPPGAAFIPAPTGKRTGLLFYRPYIQKPTQNGKQAYVLATEAETRANPKKIAWAAYQVASAEVGPDGSLRATKLRHVSYSRALLELARVRAQQEALAKKSAMATPKNPASPILSTTSHPTPTWQRVTP